MITSDEPGVYLEGEYGIRIENEILCTDSEDGYRFEMLTLCHYEREAIAITMLTDKEISYIDHYHSRVCETLLLIVSEKTAEQVLQGRKRFITIRLSLVSKAASTA